MVEPQTPEMYWYNRKYHDNCFLSESVGKVVTSLDPLFFQLASNVLDHKINLSVVFDQAVFDKVRADNSKEIQKLLNYKQFKLYVYPRSISLLSFQVTDSYLLLRPLTNDGTYDHMQLISNSREAVELGRELFDYYLKGSIQITEL